MGELVSIVVPVYNVEKYLDRCVDSLVNQTYSNLQIILVDDGATDTSGSICDSWELKDKRIKVIHKSNGGLASARKVGFEVCKGEYVSFIDSDDYLEPTYIEELYNDLQKNGSDIAVCGYYLDDESNITKIDIVNNKTIFQKSDFLNRLVLPNIYPLNTDETALPNFLWLKLFKKDIITNECFVSEREVYTEDLFFNIKAYMNCNKVSFIDKPLYHYCMNSTSLTNVYRNNKYKMERKRLDKILEVMNRYDIYDQKRICYTVARMIWGCIDNAYKLGSFKKFKEELTSLMNDDQIRSFPVKTIMRNLSISEKVYYCCYKSKFLFVAYLYKKVIEVVQRN